MSVSGERELEEFLAGALSGKADPPPDESAEETVTPPEEVVHDEAPGVVPPVEEGSPVPPLSPDVPAAEAEETPAEEPAEGEEEEDSNVVWATKKFGKEPANWAKAAYEREQHISRLTQEKQQAEQVAAEAIQYARNAEATANASAQAAMPMSAAEEQWVDEAMSNPVGYAYTAARNGNAQLYNAVIERVAEDNPGFAAQIGTQVSMALREEQARYEAERAAAQNGVTPSGDLSSDLNSSFQRLQIDVQKYGEAMWTKIEELGEYHPYTLAILGGDPMQRDLAVSAVYDLVRAGTTTTRRVADTEREEQIRREGELRREAASVVTGSPHVEPTKQDPLFAGMEEEWRRRGQWPYPEE